MNCIVMFVNIYGDKERYIMLRIIYCEQGNQYSDFNLLENAQFIINHYKKKIEQNNKDIIIKVSTSNIIQALRVLVSREKLSIDEICFVFGEYEITMNKYCEFTKHPIGFMDWEQKFLREIIYKKLDDDGNRKKKNSLKQTIINQQHKLENAKHLKDISINLPEVEDSFAKILFDNEDD